MEDLQVNLWIYIMGSHRGSILGPLMFISYGFSWGGASWGLWCSYLMGSPGGEHPGASDVHILWVPRVGGILGPLMFISYGFPEWGEHPGPLMFISYGFSGGNILGPLMFISYGFPGGASWGLRCSYLMGSPGREHPGASDVHILCPQGEHPGACKLLLIIHSKSHITPPVVPPMIKILT